MVSLEAYCLEQLCQAQNSLLKAISVLAPTHGARAGEIATHELP